jgi:purine-nucleoside phosphorylase
LKTGLGLLPNRFFIYCIYDICQTAHTLKVVFAGNQKEIPSIFESHPFMSIHISAKPGEIAPIVLLPGDPLRAKYIAEKILVNSKLVSNTRGINFFTGTYKDIPVTIGASGMGCPSIGIYSYELYNEYDVQCIMRIGTCGSYMLSIKLFDLINVDVACSESTYAKYAFDYTKNHFKHQGAAYDIINDTAKAMNMPLLTGSIHSGDVFYRADKALPEIVLEHNCLAAEMEAFALFANAQYSGKMAATLLTVSDIIPTHEKISADERERSLDKMIGLAMESALGIYTAI